MIWGSMNSVVLVFVHLAAAIDSISGVLYSERNERWKAESESKRFPVFSKLYNNNGVMVKKKTRIKRNGKFFGYFLKLSKSTTKIPININEDWYLSIKEIPRNIAANIIWCESNCFFVIK